MSATVTADRSLTGKAASMAANFVALNVAGIVLQVTVLAYLGHLGGDALYLRSVYAPVGFLSLALDEGLTAAVLVTVAAAQRTRRAATAGFPLAAMIVLGFGGFLLLSLVALAASGSLADLLGVPPSSHDDVRWFTTAMLASEALVVIPTLVSATLRGLGRARTSTVLGVVRMVVFAGAVFGVQAVWGLGALSVPVGFMAGSIVMAVVGRRVLGRAGIVPTPRGDWGPVLRTLRSVALPVGATFLLLSATSLGYLWLLRDASAVEVSGFGLVQTLQAYLVVPAIAIGSATAITATLHGDEARTGAVRALLRLVLPTYLVIVAAVVLLRADVTATLTADPAVGAAAAEYLGVLGPSYLCLGLALAVLTYLEQTGHATGALLLNGIFVGSVFAAGALLTGPVRAHELALLIALGHVAGCALVLPVTRVLERRRLP
ncbi:Na+-driven multidrug efflux pump [Amycolatopsis xylanica]|uniref:Na+-driven multidrug efflux pump n=1 Tax=Amycolatopsis xylanica TaxID=589385 RepID=A0A1H2U2G7_9PSEU|nr:hypothetical protein [Amycolatopsis xylanica]SDW50210.1 Na+-driven multidrug efflux pump [Amycolatopsis xylanica]